MKKISVLVLGWILVLVGLLGIVLPILPGIPLLLVGLVILARHYSWAGRLLQKLRAKIQSFSKGYAKRSRTSCS
ncbi:MAG TPA: PGPGW domain-containing protein [Terriglobales bacterium]